MAYLSIFHLISDIIKKTGIQCVLIGGFAVNYYKVTRQTADVDFLITKDDFLKALDRLKEEGFKIDYQNDVFAGLSAQKGYIMDLDFMFVENDTLDKILKDSKEVSMGRRKFLVPSLEHLIALKLHAIKYNPKVREYKDLMDIIELIKVNNVNIKSNNFKELCLKYGTEVLYNKLLSIF